MVPTRVDRMCRLCPFIRHPLKGKGEVSVLRRSCGTVHQHERPISRTGQWNRSIKRQRAVRLANQLGFVQDHELCCDAKDFFVEIQVV